MAICPTVLCLSNAHAQPKTVRELGLAIGVMPAGRGNAITDVAGVRVGHMKLVQGDSVRTGGIAHHGSGDHVISFSTDTASRISHQPAASLRIVPVLHDDFVSPLFLAVIEATEEAILNSLFMSGTTTGKAGKKVEGLPVATVMAILDAHKRIIR